MGNCQFDGVSPFSKPPPSASRPRLRALVRNAYRVAPESTNRELPTNCPPRSAINAHAAFRSGRSKECPQDARYANCVGGGHEHIEDPFNKQFTAVGNGRKAEAEYDEKCRQRDYVDRR